MFSPTHPFLQISAVSAPIRSIWYSAIPYADGTWSIDEENLRDELDGEGFRPIILISDEHDGKALFVPVTRTGRTVSISHPVPDESPLVGFADCMDIWGRPMPHEPAETYIMPLDFVQEVVRKMLLRFNLQ